MIRRIYIYGAVQICISFIVGLYVNSITENSLLLTDGILDDKLRGEILAHPFYILGTLGFFNLLFFFLSHQDNDRIETRKIYNNICNSVFNEFIKANVNYDNSNFRVSLFKIKKGIIFKKMNCYQPTISNYLINVARHQTMQGKKLCKIKFLPGEGSVGNCYSVGNLVFSDICQFENNETAYYDQHLRELGLPTFKAMALTSKSSSYLSCPIKFYGSDEFFGVWVVDGKTPNSLNNSDFRVIEKVLHNYSVFFNKGN